jgi:hypothetical protein
MGCGRVLRQQLKELIARTATPDLEKLDAEFERIKWYLWHGNVFWALQEIQGVQSRAMRKSTVNQMVNKRMARTADTLAEEGSPSLASGAVSGVERRSPGDLRTVVPIDGKNRRSATGGSVAPGLKWSRTAEELCHDSFVKALRH